MGGDPLNSASSTSDENESCLEQSQHSSMESNKHKDHSIYSQIFHSYDCLRPTTRNLEQAKAIILSYKPGAWTALVDGATISDFEVPKATSLIVIGHKGSGKSTLINTISKVFDDKFGPDRAQVSYNPSGGDGTYFLQGHMMPRGSNSFCLFDTRSLSDDHSENAKMLKRWMVKGAKQGELVTKDSDDSSLRCRMKNKSRQYIHLPYKTIKVNFVIFVINGISVLKSIGSDDDDDDDDDDEFTKMIAEIFNFPHFPFNDDKPAVVITHGDLLSISDRTCIRLHLGELFGIPPKQIFDIPDCCNPITELAVVDLLCYSLERADRHLLRNEVPRFLLIVPLLLLVMFICIGCVGEMNNIAERNNRRR